MRGTSKIRRGEKQSRVPIVAIVKEKNTIIRNYIITLHSMIQSIEPNIAHLANGWLQSYSLPFKLEQESLNDEIDKALSDYHSKNGWVGGNRPDAKILLQDKNLNYYPVLIEYKGYKDKLVKLHNWQVENKKIKNWEFLSETNLANINSYAVNGAVHYANAILHHTSYTDVIAIWMTGYKDNFWKIQYEIWVYYVSKSNLWAGQKVWEYSDFSFLTSENFDEFIARIKTLSLTAEELEKLKEQKEKEIDDSLKNLNQHIYDEEVGLDVNDRVYLVAASIIATIWIPGKVSPLEKQDLKSSSEVGNRDGDILIRKIQAFLNEKNLPEEKKKLIIRTLSNTLLTENINKAYNGESQLKRVFGKIVDDLGFYYKIGLTTDFTGKLFNQMYSWIPMPDDKKNDVVLTPPYISTLLVKLARVNKDSYVWDFATGSAGLLVAAMNEMLADAKNTITSPHELTQKELKIKAEQLLGLELLSSIYMLAILNMIMMWDGSSNILNEDSLKFDGKYGFWKTDEKFPADAFVLNPPYSQAGKGMVFVEKALSMMHKWYAAIIIQNSAGSWKAKDFNTRILEKHTLVASIKMPTDIFIGKASVQTNIYVFKVWEAHHRDERVKFVDFSNDGYTRTARKKSKASLNLRDTDRAKERYEELVHLVRFGKSKLNIFTEKEYYEGTIDPESGADWNKSAPIDTKPTLADFRKTVSDYLAWEVSSLLKNSSSYRTTELNWKLQRVEWGEYRLDDLFEINPTNYYRLQNEEILSKDWIIPLVTNSSTDNWVMGFSNLEPLNNWNTITCSDTTLWTETMYYQEKDFIGYCHIQHFVPKFNWLNKNIANFIISSCHIATSNSKYDYGNKFNREAMRKTKIQLPILNGKINFEFMEDFISELEQAKIRELEAYLQATGLSNYTLTKKKNEYWKTLKMGGMENI